MHLKADSQKGSWQEKCTKELLRCARLEAKTSGGGRIAWEQSRKALALKSRVTIADAELSRASLRGFNFSWCYVTRTSFARADLSDAEFKQAIVRDCDLFLSRLEGADLYLADFRGCKLNIATSVGHLRNVRPKLAEVIQNAQYRADATEWHQNGLMNIWNAATDYGNSVWRVFAISAVAVVVFGAVFYGLEKAAGITPTGKHESLLSLTAFAAQNFLNSGPQVSSNSELLVWLVVANVLLGIGALGVFIAILSRKLITHIQ